jgi:hypothetical protein
MELYLHSTIHIHGKVVFLPPVRRHLHVLYKVFSLTGHFFPVISRSSEAETHSGCTSCVAVRTCVSDGWELWCVHCKSKRYVRTPISFTCPVDSDGLRTGRPGFDSWRARDFFFLSLPQRSHPASYPVGTGVSFSRGREADYSHLLSRTRMVDLYLHAQQVFISWCLISYAQGHFLLAQSPIQWEKGALSTRVKAITHLHLMPRLRMVELYLHSLIRLHGVVPN